MPSKSEGFAHFLLNLGHTPKADLRKEQKSSAARANMSHGNLFLPTYGKKSSIPEDGTAEKSSSRRVLPSASMPTKRSLLPPLVFNGNIEYILTFDSADKAGRAIEAARPEVLGFDIEWQVSFLAGQVR